MTLQPEQNDEKNLITRRDFLGVLLPFGFMLGFGFVLRVGSGEKDILRPPGALPEEEFFSKCIRCHQCEQVCPTAVIWPVPLKKDVSKSGTPELNFNEGYCEFCMECAAVCPTGALQEYAYDQIKLGVAVIDREACIAWSWSGCTVCHDICPESAISLDESRRPVVDSSLCNGCGLCENSCPRSQYRSYDLFNNRGIVVQPINSQETR